MLHLVHSVLRNDYFFSMFHNFMIYLGMFLHIMHFLVVYLIFATPSTDTRQTEVKIIDHKITFHIISNHLLLQQLMARIFDSSIYIDNSDITIRYYRSNIRVIYNYTSIISVDLFHSRIPFTQTYYKYSYIQIAQ